MSDNQPAKKPLRGFASMTPERRVAVSRLGGVRVQQLGVGHKFTSEEGRIARARRGDEMPAVPAAQQSQPLQHPAAQHPAAQQPSSPAPRVIKRVAQPAAPHVLADIDWPE